VSVRSGWSALTDGPSVPGGETPEAMAGPEGRTRGSSWREPWVWHCIEFRAPSGLGNHGSWLAPCSKPTCSRAMNRAERGRRCRSGGRLACRRAGHLARRKVRQALVLHGKEFRGAGRPPLRQAGRPPLRTGRSWRGMFSKNWTRIGTMNREGIPGGVMPPLYGRRDARRYGGAGWITNRQWRQVRLGSERPPANASGHGACCRCCEGGFARFGW
jgi:hypothetical protein